MKRYIFALALVVLALSACKKEDPKTFAVTPIIKFEPASINLPSDGQWHEITIKPESDDIRYCLLFPDDINEYVAFGEGSYQSMQGEQTIYIGTGYKGKRHSVTIHAVPYPGSCFNGKLEITVGK